MSGLGSIEVLDATRPATVRTTRPVVVRAFAGSGTSWPVVAVLALAIITFALVWAPGRWWSLAVIVALPAGWVALRRAHLGERDLPCRCPPR